MRAWRRIVKVLVRLLDIMETMTPLEFASFRERLGASSGFQPAQFREIEFLRGRKRESTLGQFPEGSGPLARIPGSERKGEMAIGNSDEDGALAEPGWAG